MIGDVMGSPGREAVRRVLPALRQEFDIHLVIANGENAAGGRGLTRATAEELMAAGVDVITSGNHIWDQAEMRRELDGPLPVLRPANYPQGVPGRGFLLHKGVLVFNLAGRHFMQALDCPFRAADRLLQEQGHQSKVRVVDFHAEASSEKGALGWHLDGRVSAVVGTHTHVPTADQRVLPNGTAFVGDAGMTGPYNSVIGARPDRIVAHFLTQLPARFEVADGPAVFNSVLVDIAAASGKAKQITRVDRFVDDLSGTS